MKLNLMLTAALFLAGSLVAADLGKDDVVAAAKALAGKDNYSWKTTIENGGGGQNRPPSEGKIDKDGTIILTMQMRDNAMTAVLKGDKGAVKSEDNWQSLADFSQDQQGPGRFIGRMLKGYKAPAVDAEELAGKTKSLKDQGGVITGDLTEEGAKAFLTFRRGGNAGGDGPTVSGGKGSVKFWLKDGLVAKYEYHVEGTVSFNGNDRDVDRTTTVEIKDIGTTKVEVPAEAKAKL